MATISQNSARPEARRPHESPTVSVLPGLGPKQKIDLLSFEESAQILLRQGLNPFQQKLNLRLLKFLEGRLRHWLEGQQREFNNQIRFIPDDARQRWLADRLNADPQLPNQIAPRLLADFLFGFIESQLRSLDRLQAENIDFRNAIQLVRFPAERRQIILQYAAQLGATPTQIKGDQKAFERWFDEEAVTERFLKKLGEQELELAFGCDRLSAVIDHVFSLTRKDHLQSVNSQSPNEPGGESPLVERLIGVWRRLNIEIRLRDVLVYQGDQRVNLSALRCFRIAIRQFPENVGAEILDPRTLTFFNRAALEGSTDVWIQCEALTILAGISMSGAFTVLNHRLTHPQSGDDIFVRRHIWKLIVDHLASKGNLELEVLADNEPSPFVRQKIATAALLSQTDSSHQQYRKLCLEDPDHRVRSAALLVGLDGRCQSGQQLELILETLEESLRQESDAFVLRTGLHVISELVGQKIGDPVFFRKRLIPLMGRLCEQFADVRVRRWAAQASEKVQLLLEPDVVELAEKLRIEVGEIPPGKTRRFHNQIFCGFSKEKIARIFSLLAQDDFGFDLHFGRFGLRVTRGPVFGFRLWRLIHEFRNTATDKRQAWRHTIGRISTSHWRVPSQVMGELSETKVPGEPLTIEQDGTWRPFLPLVDDFVSILNMSWFSSKPVRFVTSQGVTEVFGPKGLRKRLTAIWRLTWHFARYARMRNWRGEHQATDYINQMREMGFRVRFCEHGDSAVRLAPGVQDAVHEQKAPGDSSCHQFFETSGSISLAGILSQFSHSDAASLIGVTLFESSIWKQFQRFADYFGSAFENTLDELLVFAGAVSLFVLVRHLYSNYTFRKSRERIPLVIGGWGTRGKSGTERLKAALLGVLGHSLVSKTTGCEAMFIHANEFGEPMEIPLFRPYEKATIWEHRNLIQFASRMNPTLFLWECMALNPSYVDVLQRQWTRDDLSTITNTYPDHEDVQGPSGQDVAETIAGFVPMDSVLLTSEEQMLPILSESCRRSNTSLNRVNWLNSGLITDDVLERFPYREHPDNIALVAAMGQVLGCEYEYSLKAMADYLVPDLGVLKTHPVARVKTRLIEFTNGMSANERFGCMGNWKRMGYESHDPMQEPGTWICGVVNNRADRIPRSKVFAKIMVEDIRADRFFLIGNNLNGLMEYTRAAWQEKAENISLRNQDRTWSVEHAHQTLERAAKDFRQPTEPEFIKLQLNAMLTALFESDDETQQFIDAVIRKSWNRPDTMKDALDEKGVSAEWSEAVVRAQSDWLRALIEYDEMHELIEDAPNSLVEEIEQKFIALLEQWFQRKFIVIDDDEATGEEVLSRIVTETPPGFLCRAMGLQNIKGTGLDFVYRFQAWDVCSQACQAIQSRRRHEMERGLMALAAMPEIGQLCEERIRQALGYIKSSQVTQRSDLRSLIEQIERKLPQDQEAQAVRKQSESAFHTRTEIQRWLVDCAEQFFDLNDSISRRNRVDEIYRDLANQRISRQRSIIELRKVSQRQKGGWLARDWAGQDPDLT